jgi:uncharacterized membrane protein YfcA
VNVDIGMVGAGLAVGTLVGMTGMGAGSLMTPILISVFGIPATTAVGTDLVYSAITKTFGAARHHALRTVNTQLALWMATGSVPAAVLGVYTLSRIADAHGEAAVNAHLETAIGVALVLVGITVAVRTLVTIRRRSGPARTTDGELTRRHKVIAVAIGVVFGFVLGLTSVGSGVFFGMALLTLFPLATRRVVGTDLFHAAMITVAAGAAQVIWGHPNFGYVGSILLGSIPGILLGSQLTVTIPEKALRGSIAGVLSVAGFKLIGAF